MQRSIIFLLVTSLFCLVPGPQAKAQSGWFPSASIPAGRAMCDETPYKMVFNDDFDGSALSPQWLTFYSWSGMDGGDNENWVGARCGPDFNSIKKVSNILVTGGICKLFLKHDPGISWTCDTCTTTFSRNLSSAVIALPFRNPANTINKGFNSGKFEAKMRFPTWNGSWCAFWLQYGGQVNEIDMVETYGGRASAPFFTGERTRASYSTYSWKPDPNPYGMPKNYVLGYQYPKQSWVDWVMHRNFQQDLWHVYTCEWDSARIKTYVDFELVNTVWKYYTDFGFGGFLFRFPSTCVTPLSVPYNITKGFPYNNSSNCQLRLESKFEDDFDESGLSGPGHTMGSMDVDYVRIWQRHPEADNHTEICSSSATISGPDTLCGNSSYSVPIELEGKGDWSFSNDAMAIYSGPSGCCHRSYVMRPVTPSEYNYCNLSFTFNLPGCPTQTITKHVVINKVSPSPIMTMCLSTGWASSVRRLSLFATRDIPGATYEWTIYYGKNSTSLSSAYHATGRVVTTPSFLSDGTYYVNWSLKITSTCNTNTQTGTSMWSGYGFRPISAIANQDSTIFSVNAHFNSPSDTLNYNQAVSSRISRIYIEDTDTNKLRQIINIVKLEEFAPYLVVGQEQLLAERPNEQKDETAITQSNTMIFPNPTDGELNIIPDAGYKIGELMIINLYDMTGRMIISKSVNCSAEMKPFSLADLPESIYSVEIKQSSRTERIKIVKKKND
ncbi:T9SS type A sorting domain-containing protein [Pedobacter panaciterrae]|uniref:T9SS type A sorting domain-containing protein n=1 Tax=Pedobacter panaciterrae TaxID=363849 RepID=UPI00259A2BCA|nr:family 16 glycosylhydrolase [uncultured Pedobacter sp.]